METNQTAHPNNYPKSSVANLLSSDIAHRVVNYGAQALTFGVLNLIFPKRTSWFARVALPLAANYFIAKVITENYDNWVASLNEVEEKVEHQLHKRPQTAVL
jgi:hypothetical protein